MILKQNIPLKFLLLLCLMIVPCIAHAQILHLVLACDTSANNIAEGVKMDLENMKYVFEDEIPKKLLNIFASLPKSMGNVWLRQIAKCMI